MSKFHKINAHSIQITTCPSVGGDTFIVFSYYYDWAVKKYAPELCYETVRTGEHVSCSFRASDVRGIEFLDIPLQDLSSKEYAPNYNLRLTISDSAKQTLKDSATEDESFGYVSSEGFNFICGKEYMKAVKEESAFYKAVTFFLPKWEADRILRAVDLQIEKSAKKIAKELLSKY